MPKARFSWWTIITLLSLLANGVLLYILVIGGKTTQMSGTDDTRTAIVLNDSERALILTEMRGFLSAVQNMNNALAANDMTTVASSAQAVGSAAAQGVPVTLMTKLPLQFKELGLATHKGFDQLAMDARDLGDAKQSLQQLGQLMNNCVACHATYQLRSAPLPGGIQ
jgi:hypothetical protein